MSQQGPQFRYVDAGALSDLKSRKQKPVEAIPTPIPTWNQVCGEEGGHEGLAKTWNVVIGGMPGMGKSYMALNLAAHAIEEGHKVGAINFEMSFEGYVTRYLSILAGVDKDLIGWGPQNFSDPAWQDVKSKVEDVEKNGGALITNDATVFTLGHIHEAYRAFEQEGVDMVIVDYVQLVGVDNMASGEKGRAEAVANAIRTLSHKHKVVTVALSQINREGMNRADRPPSMSDLYGGMYWEANANQVVMLDHTFYEKDRQNEATRTQLIVDKNRVGENKVEIPVKWNWSSMRVEEDISYQQGIDEIVSSAPPGSFEEQESAEDEVANLLGVGATGA